MGCRRDNTAASKVGRRVLCASPATIRRAIALSVQQSTRAVLEGRRAAMASRS